MKAFFLLSCLLLFMAFGPGGLNSELSTISTATETPVAPTASTIITIKTPEETSASTNMTSTIITTKTPEETSASMNMASTFITTKTPEETSASTNTTTKTPGATTDQTSLSTTPVLDETCTKKVCNSSSECINLNTMSFCLCPQGYYYKDPECKQGRTFPGIITMSWELTDLDDKHSSNYQKLYFTIEELFQSAFANETTFGQTIILNLQTFVTSRSEIHNKGLVDVTVTNIFDRDSKITLDEVNKAIHNQTEKEGYSYKEENLCDFNGCNGNCSDTLHCECQTGFIRPFPLSPCSAFSTLCSNCNEENHKQCVFRPGSQSLECECLPGYSSEEDTCRECGFGFSGVGCKDNYILIFTVVCVIGGALLLGTIVGLIVLSSSKKRKKNRKGDSLIGRDFSDVRLETTGLNNPGFDNPAPSTGSLFPKVNSAPFPRVRSNVKSNPYEDVYVPRSIPARDY